MHLAITLLLLAAHHSQWSVDASRLAIKGIQIGSDRSDVIAKLGRPRRIVKGYDAEMGTGHWEEFHYRGLLVEAIQPTYGSRKDGSRNPYVSRIVLSGGSWAPANGLKIGMSPQETRAILGDPETTETRGRHLSQWYPTFGFDGRVVLRFRDDKLVELTIQEDRS